MEKKNGERKGSNCRLGNGMQEKSNEEEKEDSARVCEKRQTWGNRWQDVTAGGNDDCSWRSKK